MDDGVIFHLPSRGKFIMGVPLLFTINLGVQLQNDSRIDGVPVKVMFPEFTFNQRNVYYNFELRD